MNYKLPKIICAFLLAAGIFSCKKNTDDPQASQFSPVTFKFGSDSTAISIDNAVQVVKNMPRSCDVTQLGAAAVLPAGYSISPDPAAAKDYTKGVTYTVKTSQGGTYTVQITAPLYDAVNNPYGVYTARQLSDIRKGLNDSYVLMNDIQLPDLTAANAAATVGISDYKDFGWFSIGTRYVNGGHVVFRGMLDGQNHLIKNFTTAFRTNDSRPDGIDPNNNGKGTGDGLFGYANNATFKNIGIQLAAAGINDVATDGSSYGSVGSLVGQADSCTITNCYVTGNAAISGGKHTGGLIGRTQNSTISRCYAALASAAGSYAVTSGSGAGGLIGSAIFSDLSDSYASCSVVGAVDVGGLVGLVNTCTIKACFASGNVGEMPNNSFAGQVPFNSLGGLIGGVTSSAPASSIIQNCYATGAVAGTTGNNVDFHKSSRIGGLVGQIVTAASGPVSVTYCYASGAVSRVVTNASAPYLIGGLVGITQNGVFISAATCTNYWDKTTTGQTYLGGGNGTLSQDNGFTANGKTSAEMKTAATYANWNFSSVWNTASGTNNGYPYLRSTNN
jgi:hypothetical protein